MEFGNNTTNTSNSTASTQTAIPSASPAPFVFGGGQSTEIYTNFQQSLMTSVNSSTNHRLIKKPTRLLKKIGKIL
jgi:hypothetical protein